MTRPISLSLCLLLPATAAHAADDHDYFESKIRPIFVEHCLSCHGEKTQKGGLRLDSKAAWQKGGDSGPAIVPKKSKDSLLIRMVQGTSERPPEMPPDYRLPAEQAAELARWVDAGAADPRTAETAQAAKAIDWEQARQFWSFKPVAPPQPPANDGATPIDRFVLAKLTENNLKPAGPADRRTLIRRATFDLTGLPPTLDDVKAFEADRSPDAFANVVDRLLASPAYGEHQARAWLDLARYGEDQSDSDSPDFRLPHAWRYRDWVIEAFNKDVPYDRFVKLQLAADWMEDATTDPADRRALGLIGLGAVYARPNDLDRKRAEEWDDRLDTVTRAFLGLTVACARCHDHKYDPIPAQDYYSLAGVIASTRNAAIPIVPPAALAPYESAKLKAAGAEKAAKDYLQAEAKRLGIKNADEKKFLAAAPAESKAQYAKLTDAHRAAVAATPPMPAHCNGVKESDKVADLKVYLRGNPYKLGERAPRRFLRILAGPNPPPFTRGSGRLDLADAIANPANPLTARVIVNRIWQQHFGRGIVATPSNFGTLGDKPTHPELLDHLADQFVKQSWSIKRLHREVMLTQTYQRASHGLAASAAGDPDPDNRFLARQSRRRLTVEAFRDATLFVAGNLDRAPSGPSGDVDDVAFVRRTVYGKVSRHDLAKLLKLFDFPAPNISADRRTDTTLPQQALFLLNSPFMASQAKVLAARIAAEATDPAAQVRKAYELTLARAPTVPEIELATCFLASRDAEPPKSKDALPPTRIERFTLALLASNEFFHVD